MSNTSIATLAFFFSLFLSSRCDVEDELHQLLPYAGQPHTRLAVYANACIQQLISKVTPLKLDWIILRENLTVELSTISLQPFQLNNQLGE